MEPIFVPRAKPIVIQVRDEVKSLFGFSQQQICRLESPGYEGYSPSMLRRVARELRARVRVVIEPEETVVIGRVAETGPTYRAKETRATPS